MMEASTFFKRYGENPKCVQHYPPVCWADFIIEQFWCIFQMPAQQTTFEFTIVLHRHPKINTCTPPEQHP